MSISKIHDDISKHNMMMTYPSRAIPGHNRLMHMDMYDAWNYFTVNGTEIPFLKLVNRKDFEGGEHDWLPPKLLVRRELLT